MNLVNNQDGFFDNLVNLTPRELRKRGSISFQSKSEKIRNQLRRIDAQ